MQIYGWTTMSYTPSTSYGGSANPFGNLPVTWNDRANMFLLNQHWTRFERTVVTSGTTTPRMMATSAESGPSTRIRLGPNSA